MIGNCIVDEIMQLPYYPREDEELRAIRFIQAPGGNACNSARVLAKLGHRVRLVSQFARDSTSEWLIQQIQNNQIETDLCARSDDHSTPRSYIWLNQENGSRTIVHHRNLDELTFDHLKQLETLCPDWFHFEGRNIETLTRLFKQSKKLVNFPISLEIEKSRDGIEKLLPWMTLAIVSKDYLEQKNLSAKECIRQLKDYNKNLAIVCTLGSDGLIAMDQYGALIVREAKPINPVIDTLGAGDCFIAGLISALVQKMPFSDALNYANDLAALKIQSQGFDFNV